MKKGNEYVKELEGKIDGERKGNNKDPRDKIKKEWHNEVKEKIANIEKGTDNDDKENEIKKIDNEKN